MALPLAGGWWSALAATTTGPADAFSDDTVVELARALAADAYVAPDTALPASLAGADYDQYRNFRFRPDRALWRGDGVPFQAQFFHRGFLFRPRIEIRVVEDGRARSLPFTTQDFDYSPGAAPPLDDIGFAGFRLHGPLNGPDYYDELCAFLGASYFRAVAQGLGYGLSARGLAIGTGDPAPEEFPVFRAFWLHRPQPGAASIRVDALLDSPSVAGAFRFSITPGRETVFDVDARLFPRVEIAAPGIAPLTSMFQFDAGDRVGIDDYRPAVHDSDGLAMLTGTGEQVWRALGNPAALQHSGFQDRASRGFGLMQRKRTFAEFQDAEAGYERRPGAWIEPLDDWGTGEVHLVEIPTADEYHDNIVAFWRPAAPLAAGTESRWRYRIHWTAGHVWLPQLATVSATRIGAVPKTTTGSRLCIIDLDGGAVLEGDTLPVIEAAASAGTLRNPVIHRRPDGGWRVSVELEPQGATVVELRMRLLHAGAPYSETWLYRWTA
ncbi:glucan biosynthesis protein [Luteimonas cellulosilyticus]|nr:glucan biosynthesis protein G [Luteimonas cellulosilyticus]